MIGMVGPDNIANLHSGNWKYHSSCSVCQSMLKQRTEEVKTLGKQNSAEEDKMEKWKIMPSCKPKQS